MQNDQNNANQCQRVDLHRRRFLVIATRVMGALGAAFAMTPFLSSWLPSAREKALAKPIQVDISGLKPGQQMRVEWQGKPVWIIRRSGQVLQELTTENTGLRDPDSVVDQQPAYIKSPYRSINPEILVLIGLCTHLGCSPTFKPQQDAIAEHWQGGFFCPCHGSRFDMAGRVYKGAPAPVNMVVPPYRFLTNTLLVIGEDSGINQPEAGVKHV